MAKAKPAKTAFDGLGWTKQIPLSDVTDPLGMDLRVGARLSAQLLHCITSVTPRARYYSFLPWCVDRYWAAQKNTPQDDGLLAAVSSREIALALGCVGHHQGKSCERGSVVGSLGVTSDFASFDGKSFIPGLTNLVEDPALTVYIGSLINLGLFEETPAPAEDPDLQADVVPADETSAATRDDIKLSTLGLQLARAYADSISGASGPQRLDSPHQEMLWEDAVSWAAVGGYCELADGFPQDRDVLIDLFFCRIGSADGGHELRRKSLLLLLHLTKELEGSGVNLDERALSAAVGFGRAKGPGGEAVVLFPESLQEITQRWRAYYAHIHLTTALQSLLSEVTAKLCEKEGNMVTITDLSSVLVDPAIAADLAQNLQAELPTSFGNMSPNASIEALGRVGSRQRSVPEIIWSMAELLGHIDERRRASGMALSLVLVAAVLQDYSTWQESSAGKWLRAQSDEKSDLSPATLEHDLTQQFGRWRECSWSEVAPYILSKFVVRQHSSLAYEKQGRLFSVEEDRIVGNRPFDRVTAHNPRLSSALCILQDLALLVPGEDGRLIISSSGRDILTHELSSASAR